MGSAAARRGDVGVGLAAARAGQIAAARFLVDGRPGAPFGVRLGNALLLIAFLDVLGLALLLVGVGALVAAGHGSISRICPQRKTLGRSNCSGRFRLTGAPVSHAPRHGWSGAGEGNRTLV